MNTPGSARFESGSVRASSEATTFWLCVLRWFVSVRSYLLI